MTPTPPSSGTSNAGQSPDAQFRVIRKRNRVPLSCGPCRGRKLKCNRGHPCDNCTKRGDTGSCTYAAPGGRKKSQGNNASSSTPDDMQNRIDRLEGLVLSLMTNGNQAAGPAAAAAALSSSGSMSTASGENPLHLTTSNSIREDEEPAAEESETEHVTKSVGMMKMYENKTVFTSEAHWYAILGELSEVKNYFKENKQQIEDNMRKVSELQAGNEDLRPGMTYFMGNTNKTTHAEILASFPPKQSADMLITRYFNTYDPSLHIIHGPTYQQEYDQHWQDPEKTSPIWLGLSFAMMCMALQSYGRAGDEPPEYQGISEQLASDFRRIVAQTLNLVNITSPIPYMIETLLLHLYCDYGLSRDSEVGIVTSCGIIARLAMRMGYHRDSKPYKNITVFEGEMRRRVWCCVRTSDLLFSAQNGLPPIIRGRDTNTELPRNIFDDELYKDIVTLPPSRLGNEITPTSYLLTKSKLIELYGIVTEETVSIGCTDYEEIMKLDQRIRELHSNFPPHLRLRPIEESVRDTSALIMQRFSLELLYHKALVVLHRKWLGPSRQNARYAYSRRVCIESSLAMLQHQVTLHVESQQGGRLRTTKWFISSLNASDFLLAAMIVTLDLYHTAASERSGRSPPGDNYICSPDRRVEMLAAVEKAAGIWETLKESSLEAIKAHATLSTMIGTLKSNSGMQTSNGYASANMFANGNDDTNVAPEHSAAMTLGMLSTGALTPNTATMFDSKPPYPASMGNILNNDMSHAQQSAGVTPGYLNPTASDGPVNAPSPFSSLFGGGLGLQTMEAPTNDINWDAWDSYIQGANAMDAANMWPMDVVPLPEGPLQNNQQQSPHNQQNQQPQQQNGFSNNIFATYMGMDAAAASGQNGV